MFRPFLCPHFQAQYNILSTRAGNSGLVQQAVHSFKIISWTPYARNNLIASGEEWTLASISSDSLIQDNPPASFSEFLEGIEFDANGNEMGISFTEIDTLNVYSCSMAIRFWSTRLTKL